MVDKEGFPARLTALRNRANETQQQLADLLGVTKSAVYSFEKGINFPVADKLVFLARHFNVSVDYLLTGQFISDKADIVLNNSDVPKTGDIPESAQSSLKSKNEELLFQHKELTNSGAPKIGGTSKIPKGKVATPSLPTNAPSSEEKKPERTWVVAHGHAYGGSVFGAAEPDFPYGMRPPKDVALERIADSLEKLNGTLEKVLTRLDALEKDKA